MLSFIDFAAADQDSPFILLNEEKNLHMTHAEDFIIDGGSEGVDAVIDAFEKMIETLGGHASKPLDITVKWDGAPAVYAGIDPSDGKFFVAKKGIFNKTPMLYKTEEDIDNDISSTELNNKMKIALKHLSKLGIKNVVQGDMMFTKDDLKEQNIDGEKYITFHPNSIMYAVPVDSELAQQIKRAEIGIVFHTSYSGNSISEMSATYDIDVGRFRNVPSVWYDDAYLRDVSGTATLTKQETAETNKHLNRAKKLHKKIKSQLLDQFAENPINGFINNFNNKLVRDRQEITNTKQHAIDFREFIENKYNLAANKLKTDRGYERKIAEKDRVINDFFGKWSIKEIATVFELQNAIKAAKHIMIKKLNTLGKMSTFAKLSDGSFEVIGAEGYVAVDHMGKAMKLVDRLSFSALNFDNSGKYVKGWQK